MVVLVILGGVWFVAHKSSPPSTEQKNIIATSTNIISDQKIKEYLLASNFTQTSFDGTSFIAFERLAEVSTSTRVTEYLWLMSQEYYKKDGMLEKGTGVSLPIALYFDHDQPVAINTPRDGSFYTQDLQKIFPEDIKSKPEIVDFTTHATLVTKLEEDIRSQAEKYFDMSISGPHTLPVSTQATTTPNYDEPLSTTTDSISE